MTRCVPRLLAAANFPRAAREIEPLPRRLILGGFALLLAVEPLRYQLQRFVNAEWIDEQLAL